MRCYEVVLITSPEIADEGHKDLLEKVEGILKKKRKKAEKGELLNVKNWGVRRLSAPINKVEKGRYDLLTMKCLPDTLSEVERNFRFADDVLRYQTIRLNEEPVFEEPKEEKVEETVEDVKVAEPTVESESSNVAEAQQ
ncbi:MAG: 30S ribosomal protein S6 [bacterium]|nr:30S ribosomal protein S6 [bacterium]